MPELMDWAAILLRWGHVMAGIAWIGTSFYFNWFDLSVRQPAAPVLNGNVRGTLHEVHGGSFYYHEQYWPEQAPARMLAHGGPAQLTLLTGLGLMALFYWYGADVYLVDPQVAHMSKGHAIALSVGGLLLAWPLYYKLCRSVRDDRLIFFWMAVAIAVAACLYSHLFGGRAAFIQIGAMLGSIMVLSVHFVIIPNHIAMLRQIRAGEALDIAHGERAKRVSQHNNYFTLPVIFTMLSIHFPLATGHPLNWVILLLVMGFGVTLRHWRNLTFKKGRSDRRLLLCALALLAAAVGISKTDLSAPTETPKAAALPSDAQIRTIVHARCAACHSDHPTNPTFTTAPLGFRLDTLEQVKAGADKIVQRAVRGRDMPLNNTTGMTDAERAELGAWLASAQDGSK
ncbi:urate hydroxylase PuuD [Mesorhizobium sp. SP-1A]|uniref:urate hydroxylase PuuD n=1 Tax=Mesorhizobium sp. SP-1A TaxID=3077840 RepID=UPI0028F71460|nr:urate hydroxylase PuuD [Mesorhizobium sp. SP-1A]